MNSKKCKLLRRLVRQIAKEKNLPRVAYKEMGMNAREIDMGVGANGKMMKRIFYITPTLTVAADTFRGQYQALKRSIKAEYGRNKTA